MRHVEILDHKHTRTHAGQNQIHSNSGKTRDRLRNNYPEHNQIHLTMTKRIHLSNVQTDELSCSFTDGQSYLFFSKSILQFILLSLNVYPNVVLFSTFFPSDFRFVYGTGLFEDRQQLHSRRHYEYQWSYLSSYH